MANGDFGAATQILKQIVRAIDSQKSRIASVALKEVEGLYKKRIFENGRATNGGQIGNYSTKPMLVGSKSFITKAGRRSIFGTKKARKAATWVTVRTKKGNRALVVLKGGYKAFRKLNGRDNDKVDLEFTSDLRNGIQVRKTTGGQVALGFINERSANKAEWNETRFKKDIFTASSSEVAALDKAVDKEIDQIIKRVVRSV